MPTTAPIILGAPFRPPHERNRMLHEGDVAGARRHYFENASHNLRALIAGRYQWMNQYIGSGDRGVELGCGPGLGREFITADEFRLTDFSENDWLDDKQIDALDTPYGDGSLEFVVASNMVHHVPYPVRFFEECHRILKPGGHLLIQEINASLVMRMLLRLMRHEGYAYDVDVFDREKVCTDPEDLWSANCAIPNLLFDDMAAFGRNVPGWIVLETGFSEFLLFANSGGVIAKTRHVPLPRFGVRVIQILDRLLTGLAPGVFALQRRIVLRRV